MTYAFLVMMIFSAGPGEKSQWNYPCGDMKCVRGVIASTWESRALARLRVYEGPVAVDKVSSEPIGKPLIDLWFQ